MTRWKDYIMLYHCFICGLYFKDPEATLIEDDISNMDGEVQVVCKECMRLCNEENHNKNNHITKH